MLVLAIIRPQSILLRQRNHHHHGAPTNVDERNKRADTLLPLTVKIKNQMWLCPSLWMMQLMLFLSIVPPRSSNGFLLLPDTNRKKYWPPTLLRVASTTIANSDPQNQQHSTKEESAPTPIQQEKQPQPQQNQGLTAVLLQISYDGGRFRGWSAANDDCTDDEPKQDVGESSRRRRRRRGNHNQPIRSVQGVLQTNLAKLFGNVDSRRVVVEGVSRTDKGVHALSMVALVYYYNKNPDDDDDNLGRTIPGKALPHPQNSTDTTCFGVLRGYDMTVEKLGFTLNRMLPDDIRIVRVAPMPSRRNKGSHNVHQQQPQDNNDEIRQQQQQPFHPTLSCTSKTYQYHLQIGPRADPLVRGSRWYIGPQQRTSSMRILDQLRSVATVFHGRHHNFGAFRGAPRGASDKQAFARQNTTCHIMNLNVSVMPQSWLGEQRDINNEHEHIVITIQGDRFLYKMIRFMVGAMVAVASGALELEDVYDMLETEVRHKQFECAPAHGLVLADVDYDDNEFNIEWTSVNQ